MSLWTLLIRELAHRKVNALILLVGVAGASGLLVGVLASLEIHAGRSQAIERRHEAVTRSEMKSLRHDVRGAMYRLGFNAIVLPKGQSLGDWYAEDYASKTMPETCSVLLKRTTKTVDRYLPQLRQKMKWPEKDWTIIVVGAGQETIVNTSVGSDSPLHTLIGSGMCNVGHELSQALELRPGCKLVVAGMTFEIQSCIEETGTKDDITLWLNLEDAQQLLGLPGVINEILLVEHLDVWGQLEEVQRRIGEVLPDCQVVEKASETMARAHARLKVAEQAKVAVAMEQQRRTMLRAERNHVVRLFLPLGGLVTTFWVAILMYFNVRERAEEIGILMAQGVRARWIHALLFSKSVVLGLLGGTLGFMGGFVVALVWARATLASFPGVAFCSTSLGLALVMSVGACLFGTWLPARMAARTDVAVVLQQG